MNDGARIDALLAAARARLASITHAPALEAELLLGHVLGKTRAQLRAWPEHRTDPEQAARFETLLARRAGGEPLAYLLGRREFWSLELEVAPGVLIPRPDTETLVERALALIPPRRAVRIADLGTGSGAIALALASARPAARIVATDRSAEALAIARRNAERLGLSAVTFRHGDWFEALDEARFDLIVSNPPYIAADDPHLAQPELLHEPPEALIGGADGLQALRLLAAGAPSHLRPSGRLLLEHGATQGEAVRALLGRAGFEAVATLRDLEGRERVSEGWLPDA